jgi:hypothetical protein
LFFCLSYFFIEKQMTHPITPPPELLKKWEDNWFDDEEHADVLLVNAYAAGAQAGADQELDACCRYISETYMCADPGYRLAQLRAARRPKTPSLKEQALAVLLHLDHGQHNERCLIIRRALEQLDD